MATDRVTALHGHMGALSTALAQWEAREAGAGSAEDRRAGSAAVRALDAMLRDLYLIRGRLVREISAADELALKGGPR